MERTISITKGEGSINHNTRKFHAKNIDSERTQYNIEFCNQDIKEAYHILFDEAVERYNAKQKRSDRKIDNYYDKIRIGKQEKLFHEIVVQIGNRDDMSAISENGQLAKELLTEYMQGFQERNPNLYVFSAHLHMDEETPHLHVDYIPFTTESKRGLDTRVSQKKALAAQGFQGGTASDSEASQWVQSEKEILAEIMARHDVRWLQKGTHEKHLSVLDFKKKERQKEVDALIAETVILQEKKESLISQNEELTEEKEQTILDTKELKAEQKALQEEIEEMSDSKEKLERNLRIYDEDSKWQLPDPGIMQSAKAYKEKVAEPLRKMLVNLVKSLTIKCVNLVQDRKNLKEKYDRASAEITTLRKKNNDLKDRQELLKEKEADLERVKQYMGEDKVQDIIDKSKAAEEVVEAQKRQRKVANKGIEK